MSNTNIPKQNQILKSTKSDDNLPLVILIHGLHQRGFIMHVMAKHLQKYGFGTHKHDYRSLTQPLSDHSKRLNEWLEENHDAEIPIHLVGHSLGGLVIRDFINNYPKWIISHCVTLGTPHLGSISADYMKKFAPVLVGASYTNSLDGSTAPLPDTIHLGVIAGNRAKGLGQPFLNHYKRKAKLTPDLAQHDGTVFIFETRLPNAADHIILPVSHTGMLVNKEVARQTAYFLKHGKFDKP